MSEAEGKSRVAELIRTLRATRQYSQQTASEEDIRAVLNAGRRAQSSRNTQPWYFIVVSERERLQRLAEGGMYAGHIPHAAFAIALVPNEGDQARSFDLGQAAAYMQLAAWDLGIGSCVTSMQYEDKTREALQLPANLTCQIVLSFGYPTQQEKSRPAKKGGRKPLDEIVRWQHWS
ncbi:nitroreductase [Ktedonosporobacter rubrisoli]|uniref:Nitroreductase n=1 Tax=Ktedonosporobacter rubrisoli TaxID=2509675 RepID=A0A4P6JLW2_KTERU|nr:nitroreductase family protein [Ktedonosporobacter rubrisoli]QBD76257.1 nitroreductase [Ktedonosporobacter rubrisoli]